MDRRELLQCLALGGGVSLLSGGILPKAFAAEETSSAGPKRTARVAHLTDVHLYDKRSSAQGLAKALQHTQSLDDPPELIINGGDAIYDALAVDRAALESQWALWKSVWKAECSLPVQHCLGNHDVWGWDQAQSGTTGKEAGWGKQYSLDQLGLPRTYHSFDQGGWRIIVLDSMTADDETVYRGELDAVQFDWLKNELATTPAETPIAIVSHIPIVTVGALEFEDHLKDDPRKRKMLSHQDARALVHLFRKHPNVKLCLSGHTHLTERVSFSGIDFVNSGAVSGLWWKGDHYHTDEGYNVIDLFDDGTFATQYVSYGWQVG